MNKIKLTNSFHDTVVDITNSQFDRIKELEETPDDQWTRADKAFAKRIHDKLCGSNDCECSGIFGYR